MLCGWAHGQSRLCPCKERTAQYLLLCPAHVAGTISDMVVDLQAAVGWALSHAAELGCDPQEVRADRARSVNSRLALAQAPCCAARHGQV